MHAISWKARLFELNHTRQQLHLILRQGKGGRMRWAADQMGRKISESRAERLDGAAVRIKASMTSEGLLQHDRCWIVHYSTQGGVSSASAGILDIQERRLGTFKSSGPDGSSGHSRRFCPHHIFCLKKKSKKEKGDG